MNWTKLLVTSFLLSYSAVFVFYVIFFFGFRFPEFWFYSGLYFTNLVTFIFFPFYTIFLLLVISIGGEILLYNPGKCSLVFSFILGCIVFFYFLLPEIPYRKYLEMAAVLVGLLTMLFFSLFLLRKDLVQS